MSLPRIAIARPVAVAMFFLGVDFLGVPSVRPSVWVEHQNKDLGRNGPGLCFEGGTEPCAGERSRVTGRVQLVPGEAWAVSAQYQHTWMGSRQHSEGVRQDGRAWVEGQFRPGFPLGLRGRVLWQDEDLSERSRLSQTLRASLEGTWRFPDGWSTRARYEVIVDLKDAAGAVTPPEAPWHAVRCEVEGRF